MRIPTRWPALASLAVALLEHGYTPTPGHPAHSTGRYDLVNMCEGDVLATETLPADQAHRIENHCYEAGHITYQDDVARPKFLADISSFIRKAVTQQADSGSKD
jgi:hypothetical protein